MTYKQARRVALRAYKKALKAGGRGDWMAAQVLTDHASDCAFCQVDRDFSQPGGRCREACPTCPALHICKREPDLNAGKVFDGQRTPAAGLRHFRKTIEQLEALEA